MFRGFDYVQILSLVFMNTCWMTRGVEKRINRVLMWAAWLSISLIEIAINLVRPTHAVVSYTIKQEDHTVGFIVGEKTHKKTTR